MKSIINKHLSGNTRSKKLNKNIIYSLFIKSVSIVVSFLMVRVTLDYLNPDEYGIWLTFSSFLIWFGFFEIGLGSGLRNKLTESLAINNYKLGKVYVSTTYAIMFIITIVLLIVFIIFNNYIDWHYLLNVKDRTLDLKTVSLIVFVFFLLRFILKLIGVILLADQRPALNNLINPLSNLISLIIIYILTKTTKSSLIYLTFVLSFTPVFTLFIFSLLLFKGNYRAIAPSIKFIDFRYSKSLFSLGLRFFIIQISTLVLFQSSNFIISHYFGPSEVTVYNIAYKYFSLINLLFTIIIIPFWSAFTEAWVKKDIIWIKKSIKRLFIVWLIISIGGIIQFIFSDWFYKIWIGDKIVIPKQISLVLLVYFILFTFGGIYNMFINGVSKINLQMYSLLFGSIIFFPLTMFFIKVLNMGIESVVLSMIISNIYSPIIAPIQYYKIINNKAKGIWNK